MDSVCSATLYIPSASAEAVQAQVNASVAQLARGHLWQHGRAPSFILSPAASAASNDSSAHEVVLKADVEVSDALADEWLLVAVVRALTARFELACARLEDEDGEFLLIEGANDLPKWVTPANAANRVWIANGGLHLVPLSDSSADISPEDAPPLSVNEALKAVRSPAVDTLATPALQSSVFARCTPKDGAALEEQVSTLVGEASLRKVALLPSQVAKALAYDPALAALAVQAFYTRDPFALKAINRPYGSLRFPPPDITSTSGTGVGSSPGASTSSSATLRMTSLTRGLYAQLIGQRTFHAPRDWQRRGWDYTSTTATTDDERTQARDERTCRRKELGVKLAVGFEMAYYLSSAPLRKGKGVDKMDMDGDDDVRDTPAYKTYIGELTRVGFFDDERGARLVEGSAAWNTRESDARRSFIGAGETSFAARVDAALRADIEMDELPLARLADEVDNEDDDSWMDFEAQLAADDMERQGPMRWSDDDDEDEGDEESEEDEDMELDADERAKRKEERETQRMANKLRGMAKSVGTFLEGQGELDGAVFDDERDRDSEAGESEAGEEQDAESRQERMAKLVPSLPADEWGAAAPKPQKTAEDEAKDAEMRAQMAPLREAYEKSRGTFDGHSSDEDDDDDSSDDGNGDAREGVDEEDNDALGLRGARIEEEDKPSVVFDGADGDDDDVGMDGEMGNFLEFATKALGLSESEYNAILEERKERGVYVPPASASSKPTSQPTPQPRTATAKPTPKPQPRNPNLNEFDALMDRMDAELAKNKAPPTTTAADEVNEDEAMDAELANMLGDRPDASDHDYNLVRSFLESFESQGGFAGPASTLSERLGVKLPENKRS